MTNTRTQRPYKIDIDEEFEKMLPEIAEDMGYADNFTYLNEATKKCLYKRDDGTFSTRLLKAFIVLTAERNYGDMYSKEGM